MNVRFKACRTKKYARTPTTGAAALLSHPSWPTRPPLRVRLSLSSFAVLFGVYYARLYIFCPVLASRKTFFPIIRNTNERREFNGFCIVKLCGREDCFGRVWNLKWSVFVLWVCCGHRCRIPGTSSQPPDPAQWAGEPLDSPILPVNVPFKLILRN